MNSTLKRSGLFIPASLVFFFSLGLYLNAAEESRSLKNLELAYKNACNKAARYKSYTPTAEYEGYMKLAGIFRAAERSQEVCAANLYQTILLRSKASVFVAKKPEPRSTFMNLGISLRSEKHDRQWLYPSYIEDAKKEKWEEAIKVFDWNARASNEYYGLIAKALSDPEKWREGKQMLTVCLNCGYVTIDLWTEKCPICGAPKDKLIQVS